MKSGPTDLLVELTKNAAAFASAYVAMVEALLREGVSEDVARSEAGKYAYFAAMQVGRPPDSRDPWGQ